MITKSYHWKELSSGGLLEEPKKYGPYYDEESVNGYGGFDTEEEAMKQLEKIGKDYNYLPSFILVVEHSYSKEDKE